MHPNITKKYAYNIKHTFGDHCGLLKEELVKAFLFFHELSLFCWVQQPQDKMFLSEACINDKLLYAQNNGERNFPKFIDTLVVIGRQAKMVNKLFHVVSQLAFFSTIDVCVFMSSFLRNPRAFKRLSLSTSSAREIIVFYYICLIVHIQPIFSSVVLPKT